MYNIHLYMAKIDSYFQRDIASWDINYIEQVIGFLNYMMLWKLCQSGHDWHRIWPMGGLACWRSALAIFWPCQHGKKEKQRQLGHTRRISRCVRFMTRNSRLVVGIHLSKVVGTPNAEVAGMMPNWLKVQEKCRNCYFLVKVIPWM